MYRAWSQFAPEMYTISNLGFHLGSKLDNYTLYHRQERAVGFAE